MFGCKSKEARQQDHSASLAGTAATVADQLRERVVPAVGQAAGSAIEWSQPRVKAARVWAKPHVEHGIEVAAPKLEHAVSGLAPRVDTARDKIVDELLPRVTEAITSWAAASTAAKDEALARGQGAAAVIAGDAVALPRRKKKGRVLLALGLFASAAAAAAAFMKKSAPKDDPWATPIAEPYATTSNGRHSAAAQDEETTATTGTTDGAEAEVEAEIIDALDEVVPLSPLDPTADADLAEKDGKTEKGDPARRDGKEKGSTS